MWLANDVNVSGLDVGFGLSVEVDFIEDGRGRYINQF